MTCALLQLLRGARFGATVAAPSDDTIPFTLHLGGNITAAELAPCGTFAVIAVAATDDASPVALPRLTLNTCVGAYATVTHDAGGAAIGCCVVRDAALDCALPSREDDEGLSLLPGDVHLEL